MGKRRTELKPDKTGRFYRQLGYRLDEHGRRVQPKFWLGTDSTTAEIAYIRLGQLWAKVVEHTNRRNASAGFDDEPQEPLWGDVTLRIAEGIRKSQPTVMIPRPRPDDLAGSADDASYAAWLHHLQQEYGGLIALTPEDQEAVQRGQQQHQHVAEHRVRQAIRNAAIAQMPLPAITGQTLYAAIDKYAAWAIETMNSQTAEREAANTRRLKDSTPDLTLDQLDYNRLEAMKLYWQKRPPAKTRGGKSRGKPISVATAINEVKVLRRFVRWLHRKPDFQWRMPDDTAEALKLNSKRMLTEDEIARLKDGPATYTVDELVTLYRYATDAERCLLLFGVSLGFAQAEANTFRHDEIDREHEPPRVRRVRRKSQRYHEAALWPETLQAIDWLTRHRGADSPFVLVSERGRRFSAQDIANRWGKLLDRIQKDYPKFRRLAFKHLRKTAGQLVRMFADGETVGVFHARAKVNSDEYSDAYTRRDYGRVFDANMKVHTLLAPMFATAPDAFTEARKRGGPNLTPKQIDDIRDLYARGVKPDAIAKLVNVSRSTVYRWIEPAVEPAAA